VPEIFHFLEEKGEVDAGEMFRVFNMGIGMILAVEPAGLSEVLGLLKNAGQRSSIIGTIQKGGEGVAYDLGTRFPDDEQQ
jgi:phosphoribosylformylglycinamidine cyclo-ligase